MKTFSDTGALRTRFSTFLRLLAALPVMMEEKRVANPARAIGRAPVG